MDLKKKRQCPLIRVSFSMNVQIARKFLNLKRGIVAFIVHMAALNVPLYSKQENVTADKKTVQKMKITYDNQVYAICLA